jgi:signal transduction histidine kinase
LSSVSALPQARRVALTAIGLAALGSSLSLFLLDRVVERQLSELQAYASGDAVDRFALLERDQGAQALVQAVQRATDTASPGQLFLVTDPQGHKLAGNLPAWPAELDLDDDWESFRLRDGGGARAITAKLAGGEQLLVGESNSARWAVRQAIAAAALAAFSVLVAALIGVAAIWARLVGRRLDQLRRTARAIAAGERDARLPLGPGDAFDQLATTLNQMLDENARLVSGLEAVTRSLAHDMRTPLMRMRAAISEARASRGASDREDALERVERHADQAVAIFTGLADLALAESGLSREAMQPIAMDQLLRDVIDLFEPLAEARGQLLIPAADALVLPGHRQLLFQALSNLLANAIRHGPEDAPIKLTLRDLSGGAEFEVRDLGPGLSPAEASEAIRPFVRLRPEGPGLGLGLSIAAAVARLHDGVLVLERADPGLTASLKLWTK